MRMAGTAPGTKELSEVTIERINEGLLCELYTQGRAKNSRWNLKV